MDAETASDGGCPLLVEARQLVKEFDGGRVRALRGLDLELADGELVAVIGPSGCGKSTLLQLLGALDRPTSGEVLFGGKPMTSIRDLATFRAREIGFIFQSFHLIPTLTALENVQVPMLEGPWPRTERRQRALDLLESVGLADRVGHRPSQLSGGERQRVAVARSLANGPRLVLADEPTGNLDTASAARIIDLLTSVHQASGTTMLMVTHDPLVAERAQRVVRIRDGQVVDAAMEAPATTGGAS